MRKVAIAALVVMALVMVGVMAIGAAMTGRETGSAYCSASGGAPAVAVAGTPSGSIAGYSGDQLAHAARIMAVAGQMGMGLHGQRVAVMTAMGESALKNIDYGDRVGPDSRGLFQQRANGAWGSYQDRMTPEIAAANFLRALAKVEGWEQLPPTLAAHRTQRNANPLHYVPYWPAAVEVVDALSGTAPTGQAATIQFASLPCSPTSDITQQTVSAGGWVAPITGARKTSPFGNRLHPTRGGWRLHAGQDWGAPDGHPIYAAAGGVVTSAGFPYDVGEIRIDHGAGVQTVYLHMWQSGILVRPGQRVQAGELIGRVGSSGESTGPHLHFEVRINGKPMEPLAELRARGVDA